MTWCANSVMPLVVVILMLSHNLVLGHNLVAAEQTIAHEYNKRLGRGINFGNALEAPREGEWGVRLEERFFDEVKQAGFDSIRLPVKWSNHAGTEPPYVIDETFAERVDWAIENALKRDLNIVLNIHHYDELYDHPAEQSDRFVALWRQIATRYAHRSDRLYFELLNEPRNPLTAERWNDLYPKALAVVRESNPQRIVIVGPANWNNLDALPSLELPDDDRLIVTIHYYSPFQFTHQGASWAEGSQAWVGRTWGSDEDRAAVRRDLERAAAWAKEQNRPLYLGEFGAYSRADMASREKWTTFVRSEAERLGMSWAYWEFGAGFGAFDRDAGQWREPLKRALLGNR
jgi:endoglucanase